MQAEARKVFRSGFVMREADIRRILDQIIEQIGKLHSGKQLASEFQVKLQNGAIIDATALDDLLSLENAGSTKILRIQFKIRPKEEALNTQVEMTFVNVDANEDTNTVSMSFKIRADDRDWVFVTSSLLEERIEKMSRFSVNQLAVSKGSSAALLKLIFGPLFITIAMLISVVIGLSRQPKVGDALEQAVASGTIKTPLEAVIFVTKENDKIRAASSTFPLKPLMVAIGLIVTLTAGYSFFARYCPAYNFCWGDYAEEFRRLESRRQFWLIVVILGLVISVIGGILTNNLSKIGDWLMTW